MKGSEITLDSEVTPKAKKLLKKTAHLLRKIRCSSMCVPEGGAKSIHTELPFCSSPEAPHDETRTARTQ